MGSSPIFGILTTSRNIMINFLNNFRYSLAIIISFFKRHHIFFIYFFTFLVALCLGFFIGVLICYEFIDVIPYEITDLNAILCEITELNNKNGYILLYSGLLLLILILHIYFF